MANLSFPVLRRTETLLRESYAGPQQSLKGWGISTVRGDWGLELFSMEKGGLRGSQSICINSRDWGMRDEEEGAGSCSVVPIGRIRASGHWKALNSIWTEENMLLLWEWPNTGTGCRERLTVAYRDLNILEILKTWLDMVQEKTLLMSLLQQGVGLDDHQRYPPVPDVLWLRVTWICSPMSHTLHFLSVMYLKLCMHFICML